MTLKVLESANETSNERENIKNKRKKSKLKRMGVR